MKLYVYAIHDIKAICFSNPFFVAHDGIALRMFGDVVADKNTSIAKHPGDYKLYKLAEYDDVSGRFVSLDVPSFMANASDFISAEVN